MQSGGVECTGFRGSVHCVNKHAVTVSLGPIQNVGQILQLLLFNCLFSSFLHS